MLTRATCNKWDIENDKCFFHLIWNWHCFCSCIAVSSYIKSAVFICLKIYYLFIGFYVPYFQISVTLSHSLLSGPILCKVALQFQGLRLCGGPKFAIFHWLEVSLPWCCAIPRGLWLRPCCMFCRTFLHHSLHWLVYKSRLKNGFFRRSTTRGRLRQVSSVSILYGVCELR